MCRFTCSCFMIGPSTSAGTSSCPLIHWKMSKISHCSQSLRTNHTETQTHTERPRAGYFTIFVSLFRDQNLCGCVRVIVSACGCFACTSACMCITFTILAYSLSSSMESLSRFSAAQRPMIRSVSSQPVWRDRYSSARRKLATSPSSCGPSDCMNWRGSNLVDEFVTLVHSFAPPAESHAAGAARRTQLRAQTARPVRATVPVTLLIIVRLKWFEVSNALCVMTHLARSRQV